MLINVWGASLGEYVAQHFASRYVQESIKG